MFDIAPTELLLVAIVALLVIGPKDLPKAMRFVGHWVGRARGVARQFRSGFDTMVREAELAEMEKKWAEENARIMREFPSDPLAPTPPALPAPEDATAPEGYPAPEEAAEPKAETASPDDVPDAVLVEKPVVEPALAQNELPLGPPATDKAQS